MMKKMYIAVKKMCMRLRASLCRLLHPRYGYCGCCGMPWSNVEPHATRYTESTGCFPLCESCWFSLSIEERLPYYRALWERWCKMPMAPQDVVDWELIKKAVEEGR